MRVLIAAMIVTASGTAAAQEIIDRVAVSLDLGVITLSAIQRQLRMNAYLEGKPADDTPEARRAAAARLIDQALVRREMSLSRYTPIPMAEVRSSVDAYRERLGLTEERFEAELAKYGFTSQDFLQELY